MHEAELSNSGKTTNEMIMYIISDSVVVLYAQFIQIVPQKSHKAQELLK